MKITISGSTGFVGQNLSDYLRQQKVAVDGLSLRSDNWKKQLDREATAIIHLAGKAHDTENTSAPEEYFAINRDLTIELFNEFLQSNIRDFFFFSSVKAAADTISETLTENIHPNPLTPYGKSKLEAEQYILQQKLPENKRVFIIRPCMIHGKGNKGNLNLLYKIVAKGLPWPLASFHNERSFLNIDNLNFLIFEMITQPKVESGIYNFSDDLPVSTNQLITIISETLERKERLLNIPKSLIAILAKTGDVLHLPLNSERLKKLTENYVVSNQKIKSALRLQNLPISAEDGLKKTLHSFRK